MEEANALANYELSVTQRQTDGDSSHVIKLGQRCTAASFLRQLSRPFSRLYR